VQIWLGAAHHPSFRCGGWAYVRTEGSLVTGAAGGQRNTTPQRVALAGLVSALRGLPPSTDQVIHIQTTSPEAVPLAEVLAGRAQPEGDLDLWAQLATASKGYRLEIARVAVKPDTATAFTDAWANLAMDKAKATGPFTAAIPKANLAKAPGLGVG
jgi:ribonuclease HI